MLHFGAWSKYYFIKLVILSFMYSCRDNMLHDAQPCCTSHKAAAQKTVPWHNAQCHSTKTMRHHKYQCCCTHKKHFGTCNVAAQCATLWHIAPCHGIFHNAMAQKQHQGTKHNAKAQKQHSWHIANVVEQKKCHGTKHNAMAQNMAQCCSTSWRPWHKEQSHGTNHIAMEQAKHSAMAKKTGPWHKNSATTQKQHCGTKNCSVAQSAMLWHIKLCCSTKIVPQNAMGECIMPQQKTKMPPTTTMAMPPRPPKPEPNRSIAP